MEELMALRGLFMSLPANMPSLLVVAFNAIKPQVEDANIMQLSQGMRPDGSMLPNYSPRSVAVFGKRPGPMILHDEGDYWRGITVDVQQDGIEMYGTDMKTDMLELRYGQPIGLTEESIEQLNEDAVAPELEHILQNHFLPYL